jgi:ribonuclease BN (tRNA processing enzyme)
MSSAWVPTEPVDPSSTTSRGFTTPILAGQACSGYLLEHDGFRLLLDPGYAVTPLHDPTTLDAVFVSHGHPDHCADLNPLLRARVLSPGGLPPLTIYTLPGAVDAVLALDNMRMTAGAYTIVEIDPGGAFGIGPFEATTRLLPHHVPNVGVRLSAGGRSLAYTGDTGPSPEIVALAAGTDLLIAEATYPEAVPEPDARYLSSAAQAGRDAAAAATGRLVLTHLWPGTDPARVRAAAAAAYAGPTDVARPALTINL